MINQLRQITKSKRAIAAVIIGGSLFIILAAIFGFSAYVSYKKSQTMRQWKPKPVHVNAAKAKKTDWQPTIEATGYASAIESTPITTQTSGIVKAIHFDSGSWVKKGQLLFELDTQQEQAELKQAKAALKLAELTYQRNKRLIKKNAVSPQDLDQSLANFNEAKARVESIQANIDYHKVRAPYSGKIGMNHLNLGAYFHQGDSAAKLNMINPININFPVSQKDFGQIQTGQTIEFTTDTYPDQAFKGKIIATNSEITQNDLGLKVKARYPNKKHRIYPGMFVDVRVLLDKKPGVITVPRSAINYTLYGETVYALKPVEKNGKQVEAKYTDMQDGQAKLVSTGKKAYTAKRIPVKTGATRNKRVVIKGVAPETYVVTSGQNKLQPGTRVVINNTVDFK